MLPEISIITINYNNLEGLKKTMDSVFAQQDRSFEFLVIDGGSTDGSAAYIESHSAQIDYWVSENDNGIYHAMNKGIRKATGEYLLFLNSGDFLIQKNCFEHFKNYNEDILCADLIINDNGNHRTKYVPDTISFNFFIKDTLPHQSALIKRTLFDEVGLYDESLRFVSDWKFYMDAICKFNASFRHIHRPIAEYDNDGISSVPENAALLHLERKKILDKEYAAFIPDYKAYHLSLATLRNYTSSRAHRLLDKILMRKTGKHSSNEKNDD